MSGSSSKAEEQRKKAERMRKESQILSSILGRLRTQLSTMSSNIENMVSNGDYYGPDYQVERQLLMDCNRIGVTEGIVATCGTFFFLRHGPRIVARIVSRRLSSSPSSSGKQSTSGSGGGYQLDPRSSVQGSNPFKQSSSTGGGGAVSNSNSTYQQSRGSTTTITATSMLAWTFKLGLDVFASLLIGAYTSMFFTDEEQMLSKISTIPLVEGRSLVSDEMCPAVSQECSKFPPGFWKTVQSPYLRNMKIFADNCARRHAFEKAIALRGEQQEADDVSIMDDSDSRHVKIPTPGVPPDYQLDTSFVVGIDNSNNESEEGAFLNDGSSWNDGEAAQLMTLADDKEFEGWAEGMVQDEDDEASNSNDTNKNGPWY